jgi:hypothetical protein
MPRSKDRPKFAVCITNEGCDDLQVWRLYRVLPDPKAQTEDYLRVVDDSGEDYLYPSKRFLVVEFPSTVEKKLLAAASSIA